MPDKQKKKQDQNFLSVEFTDMLLKFLGERPYFHVYTVDRCCTFATLLGFSYSYYNTFENKRMTTIKRLNLCGYGFLDFEILADGEYAKVSNSDYREVIYDVVANLPNSSSLKSN